MHNNTINYIKLLETSSTNTHLANMLQSDANLPNYTVVTTQRQYAGRGQRGNSWESEADKNLIFSLLFRPQNLSIKDNFIISQIVSLSIKYTLDNYTDGITIKWPNDIYYNNSKIAGILIENTLNGTLIDVSIIGVGVNLNQTDFISDAPNPISLKQIIAEDTDTTTILTSIMDSVTKLISHYNAVGGDGIMDCYMQSLYRKDGYHNFIDRDTDTQFIAKIDGVTELGHLKLTQSNGTSKTYQFKEVGFLINPPF